MSALICHRPSSIDRRVQANYLDALNASRVRIHRQKPKALGLKFSCGFYAHLFHQGSPASGYRPLGGRRCYRASSSWDPLIRSTTLARASKRWRVDRMRRRLPPSARASMMSAAIFETGSKATTTPVAPEVPRVILFFNAGGAVNRC